MKKAFSALVLGLIMAPLFVPAVTLAAPATGVDQVTKTAGIDQTKPANSNTGQIIATLPNPLGNKISSIPDLFNQIVNVVVGVSYTVVAFFLIVSGFKFVKAQGNEKELEDAKSTFKYTIIGAVIVVAAQTIANVVHGVITGLNR